MKKYRARIADEILGRKLRSMGAVLIQGPKWCGKTTTAEQQARSILYMDDSETMRQNMELADVSPKKLLEGATPRLIDEWQLAPQLWNTVRYEVDHREGMVGRAGRPEPDTSHGHGAFCVADDAHDEPV